jgi:ribonucleoside-diphosphate reductase alpha chain
MVVSQSPITELSESQKAVLQKYFVNGESTWEAVVERVARYVASAEATPELRDYWQEKFLSVLIPMKLVPGGSILANCDHGTRGLLNCFVLSAEDNIHDITKLVSDAVLTTKFRGGVGINIGAEGQKGYIRPKNAPFQDGRALGPCAVLDMVSENSKKITTGNKARRGAFLFSMDWKHPDILEFIQAKTQSTIDAAVTKSVVEQMAQLVQSDLPQEEKQEKLRSLNQELSTAWVETHLSPEGKRDRRWHNANISVQLDDEFFTKLDAGDSFAHELWDKIASNAHATADPGLLLIDNAKRRSPIRDFVTCTNPCVTADTWVHTGEGPRQVKDLVGQQHSTYVNGELFSTTSEGFFSTGIKPVLSLQTQEGYRLRLTGNHQVLKVTEQTQYNEYTEWVMAEDLRPGDKVKIHNHRLVKSWEGAGTFDEGWLLGTFVMGGGFEHQHNLCVLRFSEDPSGKLRGHGLKLLRKATKIAPSSSVIEYSHHQQAEHATLLCSDELPKILSSFGITKIDPKINKLIEKSSFEFYRGFLKGVSDIIAQVDFDNQAIGLRHFDLQTLESLQRMMLRIGISSRIVRLQENQNLLLSGSDASEALSSEILNWFELVIQDDNIRIFADKVGFKHHKKDRQLHKMLRQPSGLKEELFNVTVEKLDQDGIESVYDCTVPGPSRFDANGLVAHNCGEIFLPPNSACNLASLVLTKFIHRNENGGVEIDWQDLAQTVAIATRFLDNVLSVAEFATPDQKHNVRNVFRQLGLGIMGWADYLKQAHIAYDSPQHLDEIDRWGGWIANYAYRASEALAAEKGACGVWPQIQHLRTGNVFERWLDSEGNEYNGEQALNSNRQDLTQVPRRNSTVLSIAPTGSIAQLAACSWAFEPDFGLTMWKQVFVDASKNEQNWIQILNPYLEALNLSEADAEIVKRSGSLKGTEFAKQHPDIAAAFKIAREVPPGWHILVQSKWQDWIDSSISKTINLPSHATVDEIKQIYRLAAKAGLKGVTIYRSGTLESEPIKVGDAEKSGS